MTSQTNIFYYKEEADEMIKDAKINYFLIGSAVGGILMFTGLVALGIWVGV